MTIASKALATTSERLRQVQEPFSLQFGYPLPRRTASDTSMGATYGCREAMSRLLIF